MGDFTKAARSLLAGATLALLAGAAAQAADAIPATPEAGSFKLGIEPWLGYGQWYIADQKGIFKQHGLSDVQIVNFSEDKDINAALAKKKGPVSQFIAHNYRHFNAAALLDTAKGYEAHLQAGGKMLVTLAGAMSTAELGITLAEMILQDKVHAIVCTGANLEEDLFNLVAHDHYVRVPYDRDLSDLVGELSTQSELFRTLWAAHDVGRHETGLKRFHHPVVGDLELTFDALQLVADPELIVFAYIAEPGSKSAEALRLLASWAATPADAPAPVPD